MALFNLGKQKEETQSCCCGVPKPEEKTSCCCAKEPESIRVLGAGCKSCHALLEATKEAVARMGLNVEVAYITDMETIMAYGVMQMPALVVNEKVVSMGRVLNAAEVEKLLRG